MNIMQAFSVRASAASFDTTDLKLEDLSDLLWAANGVNRPQSGKRTAPSAMNAQDIDIYVCMKSGLWRYFPRESMLEPVLKGEFRDKISGQQKNFTIAPLFLLLVSDISRFSMGDDAMKMVWAAEDAGIVSQNISLFCAGMDLATRPRGSMETEKLSDLLKLSETQHLMLNHPVSYKIK
jgi:SagB-type dehydrogenase family enzyme